MGQFERFMSQVTYDMSRKRHSVRRKKGVVPKRPTINISTIRMPRGMRTAKANFAVIEGAKSFKRLIGILLVAVGVVLVLTKCTGGLSAKENKSEYKGGSPVVTQQMASTYTDYIQDFKVEGEQFGQLLELSLKYKKDYAHTFAVWAVESYKGTPLSQIEKCIKEKDTTNLLDEFGMYDSAAKVYKQFIYDVKCFPIQEKGVYTYENGWKESRSFNGDRLHYGIDIMSISNKAGEIKVRSMTDGVVENIGWNQLGGYRVGIRSENGAYFYYAHLESYPKSLKEGDRVSAGEIIGLMGDTGYGEEGTKGKFPVHLHIGMAVKTPDNVEFWINPYGVLQYLEEKNK